jgi:hypothetical protein
MEVDPYVPPAVDPTRPSSAWQDSGKLWRVIDGRLQVRNMASLPDVCVYGYPEEEPGKRVSMVLQTLPNWIGQLIWLAAVVFMIWSDYPIEWTMILFFGAIFLPGWLAKKVRIMIFQSRRAARRLMLRGSVFPVALVLTIFLAGSYEVQWKWEFFGLGGGADLAILLLLFLLFLNLLPTQGPSRAKTLGDGWFEVIGTAPGAVARLEEIQHRGDRVHRPA